MAEKDLKALFVHQLKDTYFAENAILKALPQMAEAAQSEELKGGALNGGAIVYHRGRGTVYQGGGRELAAG